MREKPRTARHLLRAAERAEHEATQRIKLQTVQKQIERRLAQLMGSGAL